MKRILILITAIMMAAATGASAKGGNTLGQRFAEQDTIVVKMANGAKMILQLENMQQLQAFQNYSLDSLMRVITEYVQKTEQLQGAHTTVTVTPSADGSVTADQVVITVQETDKNGQVRKERHEVRINKNWKIDVEIEEDGNNSKVNVKVPTKEERDSTRAVKREQNYKSTRYNLDFDLGLNTFANTGGTTIPDLRPMGSRYVSLNNHLVSQIGGRKSPFYLVSGLEFAFNNYMFDKNFYAQDIDDVTIFTQATDMNLRKSKITMSSVNIPLMPMLQFKTRNGKDGFHIGAGPFAGYRLGAHSKIKYDEGGSTRKDKDRSNFNLTDFQYGATGVVGYGNLSLFVKYNANSLFKDNRGPDVNVVSFGFRLLN